jgi:quinone-modifying oxidoreductase subunit QmoB
VAQAAATDYPEKPMAPVIQSRSRNSATTPASRSRPEPWWRASPASRGFTVTFKARGEDRVRCALPAAPGNARGRERQGLEAEKLHALPPSTQPGQGGHPDLPSRTARVRHRGARGGWRLSTRGGEYAHLGLGATPDVVTNAQFEEIAAAGKSSGLRRQKPNPWFRPKPRTGPGPGFSLCRLGDQLGGAETGPYVREDYADGKAFIIYQHMRTPG